MDLQLHHRKALVLGASRGIGAAIVQSFLQEGAQVHAVARSLEGLAALPVAGQLCRHALDLTQPGALAQALPAIGPIDHLVLCVSALATAQPGDWQAAWQDTWHTDILATLSAIEDCLPFLQASDAASIVYVGSRASQVQAPGSDAYGAGKAAMAHAMKSLSARLLPRVRVNVVSPGDTFTEGGFWDEVRQRQPEAWQRALARNPMGRLAQAEEIARVAVFLASPAASFVAGANWHVDGGSTPVVQL